MNPEDLLKLIDALPKLVMFILPAIVFNFAYKLNAHSNKKFEMISVSSVVVSYILVVIINQLGVWLKSPTNDFAILIVSVILGLICGKITSSQWIDKYIMGKIFHRTIDDDIWYGISDTKHGCYIEVFLKEDNISFLGEFDKHFTDEKGSWILLQKYVAKKDGIEMATFSREKNPEYKMAINSENIERVEIEYSSESNKILNIKKAK